MHFCEKGSVGFTRLSKGSMAEKKVKNPCLGTRHWGSSGTLLREHVSYSLVQNMGHRGPVT